MKFSTTHRRFGPRSRACRMLTPDHEWLIERAESRRKLKLRGRPTMWGFAAAEFHAAWESPYRSYPSARVGASKMSSVGSCAKSRDRGEPPCLFQARPESRVGWRCQVFRPLGLSLPVAWLDTYGRRRHVGPWTQEFSPAGFPRKRGPRPAFLAHAPSAPKFVAPAGAQRCACPPLASGGSGSVSSSRP
jgi:hypothetical protein